MSRPITKTKKATTKIKTAAPAQTAVADPATFQIDLYQGGHHINIRVNRGKARSLINSLLKRNLREFPLTVIDVHGIAHTLRGVDRASYPSDLLDGQKKVSVI